MYTHILYSLNKIVCPDMTMLPSKPIDYATKANTTPGKLPPELLARMVPESTRILQAVPVTQVVF